MDITSTGSEAAAPVNTGAANTGSVDTAAQGSSTAPLSLSDDALVNIPGRDKPVKFGEWRRGLEGEYTKAKQTLSQLTPEVERLRQKQAEWERQQGQANRPDPNRELLGKLEQLKYLDGGAAKELAEYFQNQLSTRDQVLGMALKALGQVRGQVNTLAGSAGEQAHAAKISRFVKEGGYGEELNDVAQTVYAAYEGADLDEQFPGILKSHVEAIEKYIRARDKKALEKARERTAWVPGKGTSVTPGQPLNEGFKTPQEVAKAVHARFKAQSQG